MTQYLLQTVDLDSPASSIVFDSIPQDGINLSLILKMDAGVTIKMFINDNTNSIYKSKFFPFQETVGARTYLDTSGFSIIDMRGGSSYGKTGTGWAIGTIEIPDYTNTSRFNAITNSYQFANRDSAFMGTLGASGLGAVSKIELQHASSTFPAGTMATLYIDKAE